MNWYDEAGRLILQLYPSGCTPALDPKSPKRRQQDESEDETGWGSAN